MELKNNFYELINILGEDVVIDGESKKALVEFGIDERGIDSKVIKFASFKESYDEVILRGKTYKIRAKFVDEFGVCTLELGEVNE